MQYAKVICLFNNRHLQQKCSEKHKIFLNAVCVLCFRDKKQHIVSSKGENAGVEGCVSIPNVYVSISRPAEIEIQYADRFGVSHTMQANGFLARAIMHEMDHLDGIVITDYE